MWVLLMRFVKAGLRLGPFIGQFMVFLSGQRLNKLLILNLFNLFKQNNFPILKIPYQLVFFIPASYFLRIFLLYLLSELFILIQLDLISLLVLFEFERDFLDDVLALLQFLVFCIQQQLV